MRRISRRAVLACILVLTGGPAWALSSQAWMFSPAGQAWLQGGMEST